MKKLFFIALLISTSIVHGIDKRESISIENLANSAEYDKKNPEEIFTALFQNTILKSNSRVIIKFYMPKCGECLSVKLPFEKIVEEMTDIAFYSGNCESEKLDTICQELDLDKVPAFVVFIDGKEVARLHGAYSYTDLKKEFITILKANKPKSLLNKLHGWLI